MSIETFDTGDYEGAGMSPHSDGEWVRLSDHNAEIAKLQRKLIYKQAECERARAATKVVDQRWRKRMEESK